MAVTPSVKGQVLEHRALFDKRLRGGKEVKKKMLEFTLAYQMPHTNKNIAVQLFNFCIAMKKEGDAKGYLTELIYGKINFIN